MKQTWPHLFAFAYQPSMKSQFVADFLPSANHLQLEDEIDRGCDVEMLFQQLQHTQITLDLMQMLALMGWDSEVWDSVEGQPAMRNWWAFALNLEQQGDFLPKKMMVLRVILADQERYPGPEPVIRNMRNQFQKIMSEQAQVTEEESVILALIQQNAASLAHYAWQQQKTVSAVLSGLQLPTRLPILTEANHHWLLSWMNGSDAKRHQSISALKSLLDNIDLSMQLAHARTILGVETVYRKIMHKQEALVQYAEIVSYLSLWSRQKGFRNQLNDEEVRRLNNWIGSGNFYTLKNVLGKIIRYESEFESNETARNRVVITSTNRYLFWEHYQHLFREAWLLVSEDIYHGYADCRQADNIKAVKGLNYPKILIRLDDYFIFQTFVQRGYAVDLLMTDDVETVEHCLLKNELHAADFDHLPLCLLHDHAFLWQEALASTLSRHFSIHNNHAKKKVWKANTEEDYQSRKEQLSSWYKAAQQRYGHATVDRIALSLGNGWFN